MKLHGIGTDICQNNRIQNMINKFKSDFAKRILTDFEISKYYERKDRIGYLASRFCAKEAVVKALNKGFGHGVGFRDIEIRNSVSGKPIVKYYGVLEGFNNDFETEISISHERDYSIAFVVVQKK